MTPHQAAIACALTAISVTPIFLLTRIPIGMAVATATERFAAALCFVLTIGQCAFVGLYGDSMRKKLYKRSAELSEANKRIEELAELDELTGSFNRRCIMRMLDDEIARTRRLKMPCSIALIDLDWFKRINDAYGHPTGDEVLRAFAITVFANIRTIDRFGRYGGEEFLLMLPDTPADEARARPRPAARDRRRSRLERILSGNEGHDFRRRHHAQAEEDRGYVSRPRRRRALCSQGTRTQTASPAPDTASHFPFPGAEKPPPVRRSECSRIES